MAPDLDAFDHVHVYVQDRAAAERWYAAVLGFERTKALEAWAVNGGPLTLQNAGGTIHIALFERPRQACRSTVALRVDAAGFHAWRRHLAEVPALAVTLEDHDLSLSLYLHDPDGNPYEITTYDAAAARAGLV